MTLEWSFRLRQPENLMLQLRDLLKPDVLFLKKKNQKDF